MTLPLPPPLPQVDRHREKFLYLLIHVYSLVYSKEATTTTTKKKKLNKHSTEKLNLTMTTLETVAIWYYS
jgi:hypothetical protein